MKYLGKRQNNLLVDVEASCGEVSITTFFVESLGEKL